MNIFSLPLNASILRNPEAIIFKKENWLQNVNKILYL